MKIQTLEISSKTSYYACTILTIYIKKYTFLTFVLFEKIKKIIGLKQDLVNE